MNSKVMNKVLSFLLVAAVAFTTIFTPVNAATVNSRDKKLKGKIKEMHVYDGLTEIANKDTIQMAVGATKTLTIEFVDKSEKKAATHQVVAKSNNKKAVAATADYDKDLNESVVTLAVDATAKAGDKATVTIKSKAKKVKTVKFNVEVIEMVPVTGVTLDNTAPKVGQTINAKLAPENATNVASYAWQADGTPILGATTASYVVGEADLGKKIKVVVTDADGKTFESAETAAVLSDKEIPVTGVSLSETAPKVGQTIDAVLAPKGANNVASYEWAVGDSNNGPWTVVNDQTEATLAVTPNMAEKFIQVTVTDTLGGQFAAATTAAVVKDLSEVITLNDKNGLQKDGTALPGDELAISFGSSLGTPDTIIWYNNGAAIGVYTILGGTVQAGFTSTPLVTAPSGIYGTSGKLARGEYYVTIQNTNGDTFVSNSIVVALEGQAIMSDVSFEDDYETTTAMAVDVAEKTSKAILNVTFNKDYKGTLYLVEDKYTKDYAGTVIGNVSVANTLVSNMLKKVDSAGQLTNKNATAEINVGTGGLAGIYYEDADGALHCKFRVDLDDQNNSTVTRGSSYYLIWDQADINDDTPDAKTKKEDLNASESATVPYVVAPDSIKVTTFKKDSDTVKVEADDAEGAKLAWFTEANATDTNLAPLGLTSVKIFVTGTNAKSSTDSTTALKTAAQTIKEGVFTFTTGTAIDKEYAYVQIKTIPGVFAKDALTLETAVAESARPAVTSIEITESKETPEDAVVKFKGLSTKAPGKVYILQGKYVDGTTKDIDTFAEIGARDVKECLGEAVVEGGAAEVTVPNVFKASYMKDTTLPADGGDAAFENLFVAKFVPDDEELWQSATGGSDKANTVFKLAPAITTVEKGDMTATLGTMVVPASSGTVKGEVPIKVEGIQAKDQFGGNFAQAAATETDAAKLTEINKTVTNTESYKIESVGTPVAGAVTVGTNGKISFTATLETEAADGKILDKGDGVEIKVASLKDLTVTITTKDAILVPNTGYIAVGTDSATTRVGTGATMNSAAGGGTTLKLSDAFEIK